MFKKIILSLILLSNVIFTKNENDKNFDFKTDEFGQLVDKEGYIKPENYMDILSRGKYYKEKLLDVLDEDIFRYFSKRDKSKYWDNLDKLNKWKKKWQDAGFGNKWAIDSEGYVDPKTYKYYKNNEDFVYQNPDIYWEQVFKINRWRKAGYGDQREEDIEGYINPKLYEDYLKNGTFYDDDKDRDWADRCFKLHRWGNVWDREKNIEKMLNILWDREKNIERDREKNIEKMFNILLKYLINN